MHAKLFDRTIQHDLSAVDGETICNRSICRVTGGNRTIQGARIGGRTDDHEGLAIQLFADSFGFFAGFQVGEFQLSFLHFKLGNVAVVCAKRFALRQQEVARVAVLDVDDFAHLAKLGHALKQDNLHD